MGAQIPLVVVVSIYADKAGLSDVDLDNLLATGSLEQIGIAPNLELALMLFPFAVAAITLLLCVRFIHARNSLSVLTSRPQFDLARVGIAMIVWFVVAGGFVSGLLYAGCGAVFQPPNLASRGLSRWPL